MSTKITVKVEDAIEVVCDVCAKQSQIRGISWRNILDHLHLRDEDVVDEMSIAIERTCSSCRYRKEYNKRELTFDQKAKRTEYNRRRRNEINEALKLFREQNKK